MRNVFLACALVVGTSVGCSSSHTPGEYAAVGYRAPSDAGVAPARGRLRGERAAPRRTAAARLPTTPAPAAGSAEAARPGAPQIGAGPS